MLRQQQPRLHKSGLSATYQFVVRAANATEEPISLKKSLVLALRV